METITAPEVLIVIPQGLGRICLGGDGGTGNADEKRARSVEDGGSGGTSEISAGLGGGEGRNSNS